MDNKMFCFQCEQTAGCSGCTGNAGLCGKGSVTARLQDELTGALIGLAKACGNDLHGEETTRIIIEGLFTTVTNVSFHDGTLKEMIEKGHLAVEDGVKREGSGNVRMDIILSQDNKFAAVQLFQFVPYTYTPVTSVHYYTGNDAATVSAFLSKCKVS